MFLLVLEFIKCLWKLIGLLSDYHNTYQYLLIDVHVRVLFSTIAQLHWNINMKCKACEMQQLQLQGERGIETPDPANVTCPVVSLMLMLAWYLLHLACAGAVVNDVVQGQAEEAKVVS